MLLPLIIPILYCIRKKRESLTEILIIALVMSLIVGLWPLYSDGYLGYSSEAYVSVKVLLFIALPITVLLLLKRNKSPLDFRQYGIQSEGAKKSILLFVVLLPLMLIASYIVRIGSSAPASADLPYGAIMFFEAFTEEFLFRGILFILILSLTDVKIAYFTSFACFLLMHPQYYASGLMIGMLSLIVQAVLTIEIARRSKNIIGSWLLHGLNRFVTIAVFPLI